MRLRLKRGQRGFTLVELMVVMGILGVLAAIVVPAVSGTTEVSTDAQVKTDAGMVQSAIGEYYGDRVGAEKFTTTTVYILATATELVGATVRSVASDDIPTYANELGSGATEDGKVKQVTSSRWPELTLVNSDADNLDVYEAEFTYNVTSTVSGVTITDINGDPITPEELAEDYNVIDLNGLATGKYIPEVIASADEKSGSYHNYLWLVKKTEASSGSGASVESRSVVVLKLAKVVKAESGGLDALTYEQIY